MAPSGSGSWPPLWRSSCSLSQGRMGGWLRLPQGQARGCRIPSPFNMGYTCRHAACDWPATDALDPIKPGDPAKAGQSGRSDRPRAQIYGPRLSPLLCDGGKSEPAQGPTPTQNRGLEGE